MSQSRIPGSMNRGWPPTPADRQADAVAEVLGYVAAGTLTGEQRQALSNAIGKPVQPCWDVPACSIPQATAGAVVVPAHVVGGAALPELPDGAVKHSSWGRETNGGQSYTPTLSELPNGVVWARSGTRKKGHRP